MHSRRRSTSCPVWDSGLEGRTRVSGGRCCWSFRCSRACSFFKARTAWLELVSGSAGWLYGHAQASSADVTGNAYQVPTVWPGLVNVGDSFTVTSPPVPTFMRMFRASFQTLGVQTGMVLSAELEGRPDAPTLLTLSDQSTFVSQSGIVLAIPATSKIRIRLVSAGAAQSWLTGTVYFETGASLGRGLITRHRMRPTLAIDGARLAARQVS